MKSRPTDSKTQLLAPLQRALEELLPDPCRVLLAVSGGADSVALLCSWKEIAAKAGHELHVGHFDHRLRDDSGDDAAAVDRLCSQLNVPCELGTWTHESTPNLMPNRRPSEDSARKARYRFLADVAEKLDCPVIATAHHADDRIETTLLAIARGTGVLGLRGMPRERLFGKKLRIIRPLLGVRRKVILEYLTARGQSFRDDPSNADPSFARNRVRHEVLPLLEKLNPQAGSALFRLAESARRTQLIVDSVVEPLLDRASITVAADRVTLNQTMFAEQPAILGAEALRRLFDRQGWPRQRLGQKAFDRMAAMLQTGHPPRLDLPAGFRMEQAKSGELPCVEIIRFR